VTSLLDDLNAAGNTRDNTKNKHKKYSDMNMPAFQEGITTGKMPEVIYFTGSQVILNIQWF